MNYKALEKILLAKPGAVKEFPFGPEPAVFKVGGKLFALVGIDQNPLAISLKCKPADGVVLRGQFTAIKPGYHLNKDHWITISLDNSIPPPIIRGLIEDSYTLVFMGLKKDVRKRIEDGSPKIETRNL